jgi:hypothetical protein
VSWVATVSDTNYALAWRARDQALTRATAPVATSAIPLDERSQTRFLASFVPFSSAPNAILQRSPIDSTLFVTPGGAMPPGALASWRAVAHAAPLPLFWPFRSGIEGPEPVAVDTQAVHTIASANLGDAFRASTPSQLELAEQRARENLAVARQLMRAGSAPFMIVGAVTADAADVLEHVGRTRNDRILVEEAKAIRGAGVFRPTSASAGALFADPSYLPIAGLVADTLLEPATRVQLAQLAAAGFCENPREVLFGPSMSRSILAERASSGLQDLAGADRLVGPWKRWLSRSIVTGRTAMTAMPGANQLPPAPSRAVNFATGLFRLHGLRSRLAYCSPT